MNSKNKILMTKNFFFKKRQFYLNQKHRKKLWKTQTNADKNVKQN